MKKTVEQKVRALCEAKGQARGIHLKNDAQYIVSKQGKQGLKKVEAQLKKWSVPLIYDEIKSLHFYPIGWRSLSLLASQEAFNWKEKDVKDMCEFASRVSLIVRIFSRYFYSTDKLLEQAPRIWDEYFTVGKLVVGDYNESEKYVFIHIKDFDLTLVYGSCLEGYMLGLLKMMIKGHNYKCELIKSPIKEENCSSFKLSWE